MQRMFGQIIKPPMNDLNVMRIEFRPPKIVKSIFGNVVVQLILSNHFEFHSIDAMRRILCGLLMDYIILSCGPEASLLLNCDVFATVVRVKKPSEIEIDVTYE